MNKIIQHDKESQSKSRFDDLVEKLCSSKQNLLYSPSHAGCAAPMPTGRVVTDIVERLRAVLFPGFFGNVDFHSKKLRYHMGSLLDGIEENLVEQIRRGLCFVCEKNGDIAACQERARTIADRFLTQLPDIRELLLTDATAAYEGDPAARSPAEAIFCYPGLRAITSFRLAHALHCLDVPILPRVITEHAHSRTGIDIHPGATIGSHFFIDHGTGVVIGETTIIGSHVRLYQGVTLGAKSFPLDESGKPVKGIPRHPILEDDVTVYAGATILGRVTIGRGATIGGNVWLTRDLAAGAVVTQASSH